jgi:hypothetical protein
MNGECGISATDSAVGELAGPNRPRIWEVKLRPGATLLKLGDDPSASAARCLIDAAVLHADKAVLHQVQAINAVLNDRFGSMPLKTR